MRTLLFYACLPLVAYLGLKRPFWGLAIYLSANIIRPEMLFWGGNTGSIIFRISIGAALLGYFLRGQEIFSPFQNRTLWLFLWLWLAVITSLSLATVPLAPQAWNYSEEFFKLFILAWLMIGLLTDKDKVFKLADVLLFMASLLALWGWDQSFRGNERLEGLGGQAFGDSNGVAAFAVIFLPMALHKLLTAQNRNQRLFGGVATVLLGGMIVFTQSRGGLLGLIAGVIWLVWRTPKRKRLVSYILLLLLLASPFISQQYLNRMNTISRDQGERDYSSASRLVLWNAGWLTFLDNPLSGVGLLNFARAKGIYRDDLSNKYDEDLLDYSFQGFKVGHSTWFCQMLAEGGLLLTIPYLWLIFGFFWQAHRQHRARPPTADVCPQHNLLIGLEAGIFAHCVSISFIDALLSPFLLVQILLGMQLLNQVMQKNRVETVTKS